MLTVLGLNEKPGPTCTSKIVLVADGAPLAAGWPCSSTMRKNALFGFVEFARFWPDSARIKIPMAKMATSQKINRAAFDNFILLVFSMRRHSGFRSVETQLTLCGSLLRIMRSSLRKTQAESLSNGSKTCQTLQKKVTDLLPARCRAGYGCRTRPCGWSSSWSRRR